MARPRTPTEGIYRRLTVRMHGDERYMRLSPVLPSGQSLWIYLITGPHTGPIPGVFVSGRAAMAEALGWSAEAFAKAFAEVLREGLAEFDEKTRLCFIPNAIRHNIPANPNVIKSWRSALLQLPECGLRGRIFEHVAQALSEVSDAFGKAFVESCGKAFAKASPKDSGKQEQKQEQQQHQKQEQQAIGAFERFWTAYPRKVGKEAAHKAFSKLDVTEALLATILAALSVQRLSTAWTKDGGQFIPHPATWLNGRRWNDETPPAGVASTLPRAKQQFSESAGYYAEGGLQ